MNISRFSRLLLLALLLAPASVALRAQVPELKIKHSTLTLISENDKYFAGTDRHYTNGFKLTWLGETDLNESTDFVKFATRWLPWMHQDNTDWHYKVGFALGHNIYTPSDTDTTALQPNDRPYAAWLYGSILLQAQVDNQLRLIEISAGIVGPSAMGKTVQNAWHDVINVPHAQGWANQLHDEPGLQVSWERRYRTWQFAPDAATPLGCDLILRHRITLGNVATHLAGGAVVRLGWHLPADFGADLIRPTGGSAPNGGVPHRFSAQVYASGELRVIGRDIFLDGNTWRDSPSIAKRPLMADVSLGFVLSWPSFQIAYTQNYRTKEFYGQPHRDVFGSVGITFSR